MKPFATSFVVVLFIFAAASPAGAQSMLPPQSALQQPATIELSGPRVGMTILNEPLGERFGSKDVISGTVISQFGWQKEKRFYASPDGVTGLTEFVFLAGGLDKGVLIPSLNWLVGVRSPNGAELAVGPNITPFGVSIAIAGGITYRTGNLNFPVNLAVVPGKAGTRVSILVGFNARK